MKDTLNYIDQESFELLFYFFCFSDFSIALLIRNL